jgi:hypothetical protein
LVGIRPCSLPSNNGLRLAGKCEDRRDCFHRNDEAMARPNDTTGSQIN